MRKVNLYLVLLLIGVSSLKTVYGQAIWFTTVPDTVAAVDELYVYDANVYSADSDTSFVLEVAPGGMSINGTNGLITWTPSDITDGGKVVVSASNSVNTITQVFYIYVTGPPDCDTSTIAYWKLDETEGPVYKDSYGTHNASVSVNEPGDSSGVVGKCQKFIPWPFIEMTAPDHSDFDFDPDQSFSISFWLKTSEADHDSVGVIIGRNDGTGNTHWWIGVDANNILTFLVRDFSKPPENYAETYISGDRLYNKQNTWHHAVAVHDADADRIRIYFNGSSDNHWIDYNAHSSPGFSATSPLCIGFLNKADDNNQYPFHGSLDEMIIFNKALSTDEIDTLYSRGNSGRAACDKGNSAPLFRTDPVTEAYEDIGYSYQFLANDIDAGDVLVYDTVKKPAWLNYNAGTRTLSGTPTNNEVGSDSVVIKVNDGSVDVYQRFLLTVVNTNDAPVITSTEVTTVNEDEPYSYDADADDDDAGDNLAFSLQPPTPGWLSVNPTSGLVTGTPPLNDTSAYTVSVRATDDSAAYDEQTYTLDIRNINDAPQINGVAAPLDVDEDNSLLIELSDIDYTDVDNSVGELTLNVLSGNNYSVNANTITLDLNYFGALLVNIEISDPDSSASGQIDVTVNPVNDPPVIITFPDETAWTGQSYSYVFNATDVELDERTYSIPEKPDWLTWVEGLRTLSGTPGFSDIGIDTLSIRVNDGTDNTDSTFYITVNTENNIPGIISTPVTVVNEDEEYLYNILFNDDDPGDVVTLSYVVKPGWLTLDVPGQVLSGTPTNDQVEVKPDSTYLVKLRVTDGKQDSTQTFHVTVTNINDAPVILGQNDTTGGYIDTPFAIELDDLIVEDVDNILDSLTLTVLPPASGTHYSLSGSNIITIADGVTDRLIEVSVRVSDPGPLHDEGILYVKVLDFVGFRDLTESDNLVEKIYPVPAGEFIKFVINCINDYKIELIDITGKTVFEEQYTKDDRFVEINTGNLSSGLYIFEVSSELAYQVGRITISKSE